MRKINPNTYVVSIFSPSPAAISMASSWPSAWSSPFLPVFHKPKKLINLHSCNHFLHPNHLFLKWLPLNRDESQCSTNAKSKGLHTASSGQINEQISTFLFLATTLLLCLGGQGQPGFDLWVLRHLQGLKFLKAVASDAIRPIWHQQDCELDVSHKVPCMISFQLPLTLMKIRQQKMQWIQSILLQLVANIPYIVEIVHQLTYHKSWCLWLTCDKSFTHFLSNRRKSYLQLN